MSITLTDFETIGAIALPALSAAGTVRIVYDTADNTLKASSNGGAYVPFALGASSPWIEAAGNVSLVAAANTVSVGTSTAPPLGTEMSVQGSVAPSAGPPSVVVSLSVDGAVTGPVTPFTGTGISFRVTDLTPALKEIARFGAIYTDVTLGAESAGMGAFCTYLGAAPALCVTLGPDGLGVYDVTAPEAQISLHPDIGGTQPSIQLGAGAGATDWKIERTGNNHATIGGLFFLASLGAFRTPVNFGMSPYAVGIDVCFMLGDPTGGNILINLPPASASAGRILVIIHDNNSPNTISAVPDGAGPDTIDLALGNLVLMSQQVAWLISDGTTNWKII